MPFLGNFRIADEPGVDRDRSTEARFPVPIWRDFLRRLLVQLHENHATCLIYQQNLKRCRHPPTWQQNNENPERKSLESRPGTISQETSCGEVLPRNWRGPSATNRMSHAACRMGFYLPVPLSCTVCAPTASLMFNIAVRAPVALGMSVTVMVQSQPALRLDPQVDFSLKSPGSVPPSVMLLIASDVLWSLVRMTVAAFFRPTVTDSYFTLRGETLTGCVALNITETKLGTKVPTLTSATSGMPSPLKSATAALVAPLPV